jgi:MFS family permease
VGRPALTRTELTGAGAPARVRYGRLMLPFAGILLVMNTAQVGVGSVLIPNRIAELAPADKTTFFGLVMGAGAVVAVIVQPVVGALSDRTRSRFGRRTPWMASGAVGAAAGLLVMATTTSLVGIAVAWCVSAACLAAMTAPINAVVPDRTPPERRGTFSALAGLALIVGSVAGAAAAAAPGTASGGVGLGYVLFGLLLAVGCVPLAVALREPASRAALASRLSVRRFLAAFWVSPRAHPDFALAFVARFALVLGYWSILSYQLYILQDYIGLSTADANAQIPVVTLAFALGTVAGLVPSGLLSDRLGRRKAPVVISSVVVAISAVLPLLWPTLAVNYVSVVVAGLGFGCYLAVDQALMTLVLPTAGDSGKDLGLLNIAQAGAQALAPVAAAVVIAVGGYPAVYLLAVVLAVVAALVVLPIRSVR